MRLFFTTCLSAALVAFPVAAAAQPASSAAASAEVLGQSIAREVREKADGALEGFYARRGFWPVWIEDGSFSPAAAEFLELIETADADGLDPEDYEPRRLRELMMTAQSGKPEALARAELALSREFADFVRDTRQPRIEMRYYDQRVEPRELHDEEVLRRAAVETSLSDYIEEMEWMSPYYRGLREAIVRHQEKWRELPRVTVPAGSLLKEGASGERVRLLRQRLGLPAGDLFDEELAEAVGQFQRDFGLGVDRAVGPNTLAALNAPRDYLPHLRVNLERARLLPDAGTRHVVVNAAEARLTYFDEGEQEGSMKVVVGTSETPTPLMAGVIHYATLNPYWNVPVSLVEENIAPKVLAGNSLTGMGYEALSDWTRDADVIDPKTIDWKAVAQGREEVRVRQLPSKWNAMGKVKYLFPNDLGIYLHDTPSRELFNKESRQFSNGCVRLEDAAGFGEWLFEGPIPSTSDDPEQYIPLPESVPIYITYMTAVPSGPGLAFFEDVYGHDRNRSEQLAAR